MKAILFCVLLHIFFNQIFAPPVQMKQKKEQESEDDFDWMNNIEYKQYLMEVLTELEKDKDFQKRLQEVKDRNDTDSIANQLEFVSHGVRTRLDEIKRREVTRLNELAMQKEHPNDGKLKFNKHLDHGNPHTFETKDLQQLMDKVASDLVQVDEHQEEEFKKYEMEKELKRKEKLNKIKDKKKREEEERKIEESKRRHKKHEKIHHPGSEEQLKDVWEKEDHLDREAFDHKTFFRLHDHDNNGMLDETEIEALMMKELDKVYQEGNPDDDMMERYHEMMKMRQELMKDVDTNNDKLISIDELDAWTKKKQFKEDTPWKTTEELEKPVYDVEDYAKFVEEYKKEHPDFVEDSKHFEDTGKTPVKQEGTQHMSQGQTQEEHQASKVADAAKHAAGGGKL